MGVFNGKLISSVGNDDSTVMVPSVELFNNGDNVMLVEKVVTDDKSMSLSNNNILLCGGDNMSGMVGAVEGGDNVDATSDKCMSVHCKSMCNEDEIAEDDEVNDGSYYDVTSTQNSFESESGSDKDNSDNLLVELSLGNDVCRNCCRISQTEIFELTCYSIELSEHSPDNV